MKFEIGDIVTFKAKNIGDNLGYAIYEVIHAKSIMCSLKQLHSGRVQSTSYYNKELRKLTPAELILYGPRQVQV